MKKELETKGCEVFVPQLPDSNNPKIENWVPALADAVGDIDENTYFVGHSMGCQTIARFLEALPEGVKIGGAVFVAGFFKELTGLVDEEVKISDSWLNESIDLLKIKTHLDKSVAIFSDDDEYVPLTNVDDFKEKLGSEIIIVPQSGHFNESAGFLQLPVALRALESVFQTKN